MSLQLILVDISLIKPSQAEDPCSKTSGGYEYSQAYDSSDIYTICIVGPAIEK
ncbi:7308_t:CDS:2 [Rhizophagus irregularis]|nr:7308_t:CDS:2 [Rhizophagus irregularis]